MKPEMVETTPFTLSKSASTHQKQPAAKVAFCSAVSACAAAPSRCGCSSACATSPTNPPRNQTYPMAQTTAASRINRWLRMRASFAGLENHRHTVHAVPEPRRPGPVGKHMAEMPAAACAVHLRADHEPRMVDRRPHGVLERRPEAGPARSAVELRLRREERVAAPRALKDP